MGLPQKDPEPGSDPVPGTSGTKAKPKGPVAKKSTKPSPALKPLLRKRPSDDQALQAAKQAVKQPKMLSPGDVGYYEIPQPFPKTSKRFSFGKKKKKGGKHWRPGTRALREVRHWQRDIFNLIPKAPFRLLCREIVQDTQIKGPSRTKRIPLDSMRVYNISEAATDALQEAGEAYLVGLMDDVNLLAIHARRQTLLCKDIELAKRIRGDDHRFQPLQ